MKEKWIHIAVVITGIVLTVLIYLFLAKSFYNGITMFDEPGDYIEGNRFKVFQVIDFGVTLASGERKNREGDYSLFLGPVVLFVNNDGRLYYDDEIIEIPLGKRARQIGIYKYETERGYKTVPVVSILE
ncbi:hypothetical protein [Bacteroides reticulotermitis]|nr:hypothetical protein [Bacteroides reticulotermitis]MBB4045303.1 hypothetical protein [Bacteroides reticulotermitis]